MNAATRAAVAYCLARGHTPIALHNGFPGLIRHHSDEPLGAVREIKWIDAEGWANKGGSEIGTNRGLPSEDLETVAFVFKKYSIQALFVVGGFEAFTAVSELRRGREHYKAFKIPMVGTSVAEFGSVLSLTCFRLSSRQPSRTMSQELSTPSDPIRA